jgi:hypothetical protein
MEPRVVSREELEERKRDLLEVLLILHTYTEAGVETELAEIRFLLGEGA